MIRESGCIRPTDLEDQGYAEMMSSRSNVQLCVAEAAGAAGASAAGDSGDHRSRIAGVVGRVRPTVRGKRAVK